MYLTNCFVFSFFICNICVEIWTVKSQYCSHYMTFICVFCILSWTNLIIFSFVQFLVFPLSDFSSLILSTVVQRKHLSYLIKVLQYATLTSSWDVKWCIWGLVCALGSAFEVLLVGWGLIRGTLRHKEKWNFLYTFMDLKYVYV